MYFFVSINFDDAWTENVRVEGLEQTLFFFFPFQIIRIKKIKFKIKNSKTNSSQI